MKKITAGKTNQSLLFNLANKTATDVTEYKLGYIRYNEGDGTSYTENVNALTALGTITTAHTDNKAIFFADGTSGNILHMRVDFPDGAFATGKDFVICNVYDDGNNVIGSWEIDLRPDLSGYVDGYVHVDSGASNTNTILGEDGTETNPVSTITAGKTLADQLFKKIEIVGSFSNVNDSLSYYHINSREGITPISGTDNDPMNLSNAKLDGIHISGGIITSDSTTFNNGVIDTVTQDVSPSGLGGYVNNCRFEGENGLRQGTRLRINQCHGTISGTESVATLSFNGSSGEVTINGFKGTIIIKDMTNVSHKLEAYDVNAMEIDSSCVTGSIKLNRVHKMVKTNSVTATISIGEAQKEYPDKTIYFDDNTSNTGTLFGHDGRVSMPVLSEATAKTMLGLLNGKLAITGLFNVSADFSEVEIIGQDGTSSLQFGASGNVTNCKITGFSVGGGSTTMTGAEFHHCRLNNIDSVEGRFFNCGFAYGITTSGNTYIDKGYAIDAPLQFEGNGNLKLYNFDGSFFIRQRTSGIVDVFGHEGDVTIENTVSAGTITIYTTRPDRITDNSVGSTTVNIYGISSSGMDWTSNELIEIKAVLGITNTGVPDSTPTSGVLQDIQSTVNGTDSLVVTMSTEQLVDIESKIDSISANVDTSLVNQTDIENKIDIIDANVDTSLVNQTNIEGKIDVIDTNVDTSLVNQTNIEGKIDTIDTNVDTSLVNQTNIEGKIDTIDTNVDTSLVNQTDIENKIDIIDTNVDTLSANMDTVLVNQTDIENKIDIIDTNVDTSLVNQTDIENKIDIIDTNVDTLSANMDTVLVNQTDIENKIDIIDGIVDGLEDDMITIISEALPSIQDVVGYVNGYVYFKDDENSSGTTIGLDGTLSNPNSAESDTKTLADLVGRKISVEGSYSFSTDYSGIEFIGKNGASLLNILSGANIEGCFIREMRLTVSTGISGDNNTRFKDCYFQSSSNLIGLIEDSVLNGDMTLAGKTFMRNMICTTQPLAIYPSSHQFIIDGIKGEGISIEGRTGNWGYIFRPTGTLTIGSSCTGGQITIYTENPENITDNSGVGCTVTIIRITKEFTTNEVIELKTVLGITDTGTPDSTPTSGALKEIQGTNFDTATDSLEAIRDRGDVAWISAGAMFTANELAELKIVLGITDTGTPDSTPTSGVLKEIQDNVDVIEGKIDTIDTNVDTSLVNQTNIEGKIDTIDTNVDTSLVNQTNIEGKIDTIDTNVDTLSANMDTVLVNQTDIENKIDIIDTNVDTSLVNQTNIEGKVDVIDTNVDTSLVNQTNIEGKVDDIQGATFDTATDSLEAIRDRGDDAWISGMGGTVDYSKYYNGCIYYDESAGNVNTVLGTDGTPDNPVSSWTAFKTLAIALGTRRGIIKGNMNIDSACKTFELMAGPLGSNSGATEVSQIYITSSFEGVTVRNLDISSSGLTTGIAYLNRLYDCLLFFSGTAISGELIRCLFIGNTSYDVINYSTIHGGGVTNTWENITFNFVTASSSLGVKDFKCTNILLTGMVVGNEAFIEGHKGVITIDAGCTGGTLKVVGDYKVIDNASGAVTVVTSNNGLLAWNGTEVTGDGDWSLLKSVVDAIKVVTDKMVFTVANLLNVNVKAIADDTDSATRLSKAIKATETGIVGSGVHTTTSIASSDLTTLSVDALKYGVVNFTSGVNKGRSAPILTIDMSGGMTFNPSFPLVGTPSQGDTFTAT